MIRSFPAEGKSVVIEHEEIPGFMPAMTMPFEYRDSRVRSDFKTGDAVGFRLIVTGSDSWITDVKHVDPGTVHLAKAPDREGTARTSKRLKEGDHLPAFQLTSEEGKPLDGAIFRGAPLVLTFIFTRCPIPNFCPLMSKQFRSLQEAIRNGEAPMQTRLLSVSFDPEFDTPAVLQEYAKNHGADPAIWQFATGTPAAVSGLTESFSVYVKPEGGSITHGLATVLVGPDGIIRKIWRGNAWSPEEVIAELKKIGEKSRVSKRNGNTGTGD